MTELSLSGPGGQLPAGDVQWAFGAEYRRESASNVQDPQAAGGVTGFVTADVLDPSVYSTRELFAELRAPLLQHLRLIEGLELVSGARYSRYSAFGATNSLQGTALASQPERHAARWLLHGLPSPGTFGSVSVASRGGAAHLRSLRIESHSRTTHSLYGGRRTRRLLCSGCQSARGRHLRWQPAPASRARDHWTGGLLLRGADAPGWTVSVDYWRVQLGDALDSPSPLDIVNQCAATGSAACALPRTGPRRSGSRSSGSTPPSTI